MISKLKKKVLRLLLGSDIQIREYSDKGFAIYSSDAYKAVHKNLNTLELFNRTRHMFGHSNVVSTIEANVIGGRASGRTTRQIDFAIQAIFTGKTVAVYDHHDQDDHRDSSDRLFKLILSRLSEEHHLDMMLKFGYLDVNNRNLTFSLTKKYYEAREFAEEAEKREERLWYSDPAKYNKDVLRIT